MLCKTGSNSRRKVAFAGAKAMFLTMKKKKAIGALVMAAMILVSVPLGAVRSFERLREKALEPYYYDSTGYALYDGLEKQREAAQNLLTVAERYRESDPELTSYIDDLTTQAYHAEVFTDPGSPSEVLCHQMMCDRAEALAEKLEETTLSEKDEKYPRQLISQMRSEQDKLERSSYNDSAREYNQKLDRFFLPLVNLDWSERLGVFGEFAVGDVVALPDET